MEHISILVVGEVHQDLILKTKIFSSIADHLSNGFFQEKLIQKSSKAEKRTQILKIIDDLPKKNAGDGKLIRGGNGNNSAELLSFYPLQIALFSVIGNDASWIVSELQKLGINTDWLFQINAPTPMSIILEDPFITKIFIASNFKDRMQIEPNFVTKADFSKFNLLFFTPLALKFKNIFERTHPVNQFIAVTLEKQKIQSFREIETFFLHSCSFLFANLADAASLVNIAIKSYNISDLELECQKIDAKYQNFAKIRVYTFGKYGTWLIDSHSGSSKILYHPIFPVEIKNRAGAGDSFAAGFLATFIQHASTPDIFAQYSDEQRRTHLHHSLQIGSAAAALRLREGRAPTEAEIVRFLNEN